MVLLLAGQTRASTPGLKVIELLKSGAGADEMASGVLDVIAAKTAEELGGCASISGLEIWTATALDVMGTEDESGISISEDVVLVSPSPPKPGGMSASSLGTAATDESGETEIEDTGVLCWKALI
jgi:hypothetical protein